MSYERQGLFRTWQSIGQSWKVPKIFKAKKVPEKKVNKAFLCEACAADNCNACDGGECRCVCALELDERRRADAASSGRK